MTSMLIMAAIVVLMGLLAIRFGADTRDGQDWREQPDEWRQRSNPPFRTPLTLP